MKEEFLLEHVYTYRIRTFSKVYCHSAVVVIQDEEGFRIGHRLAQTVLILELCTLVRCFSMKYVFV